MEHLSAAEDGARRLAGILSVLPVVILLISAMLTAGYLFPVAFKAFFPGEEYDGPTDRAEPSPLMTVPMILLCGVALIMGIFGVTILNGLGF
jgi:multicomponent Na+:H+ antiporter subunit D